ncbi:MAG: phosphopentomutase, partial [Hoeflea sp.]
LDQVEASGKRVFAVGKIGDIFAHQGVTNPRKASGNPALFDATLKAAQEARDGDLVFTNFVDFDMLYGHRRDVPGYAAALEAFDARLPAFAKLLKPGDLVIMTADHGCDPTWRGTDHTRERVPVLGFGPGIAARSIGIRKGFSDIGATVAAHLGLPPLANGRSFL